jgi:hypothetical protein
MISQEAHAVTVLRDARTWSSDSFDGPLPNDHDRWLAELADEDPDPPIMALCGLLTQIFDNPKRRCPGHQARHAGGRS